jgi:uncharacterized protein
MDPQNDAARRANLATPQDPSSDQRIAGFLAQLSGPFTLVIVQPSPLCNVDCTYCYVPGRRQASVMSVEVATAIAHGIARQNASWPVTVLWHAGEPLAIGRKRFEQLLEPFEDLRREGKVKHATQTNGTLIDEAWCELFNHYEVRVGVSIDGPRELNVNRVDWRGGEIFDRVMRGIDHLKAAGIRFGIVAIVSPETIGRAHELLAFVDALGADQALINLEERENANTGRPLIVRSDAVRFWDDVLAYLSTTETRLQVRPLTTLAQYLTNALAGEPTPVVREPLPGISWAGDVVLATAELTGATAPEHGNFIVGNVLRTPLPEIIAHAGEVPYVRQYAQGLANCQASCSFWDYCGGANNAGNRWFEHRDFAATETAQCRNFVQAPVIAMRHLTETEPASKSTAAIARRLAELASDPG